MTRAFLVVVALLLVGMLAWPPPAAAEHASYRQARSTIVIQNMTPAAPLTPLLNAQVAYYRGIGWNAALVQGTCQPNMPCVRVWAGSYPDGYAGLTQPAALCTATVLCKYGQTAGAGGYTRINLNLRYTQTTQQWRNVLCHELGHAFSLAHNTSLASCMYPSVQSPGNSGVTLSEVVRDLNTVYAGVPR